MSRADAEMLEKYKARIKKQNDKIKEDYDRVTATLPKGTIDRIKALGLTINGVINESLLTFLDCMEEEQETPEEATEQPQTEPIKQPVEEVPHEQEKAEYKPITEKQNSEFLRMIAERKAEQEKREEEKRVQKEESEKLEKEKRVEELKEHLQNIRNGVKMPADEEKERTRAESLVKANMDY